MSEFIGASPKLGYKVTTDQQDGLLGRKFTFADVTVAADGTETTNSGMQVEAVWVENSGATALPAGTCVKWDSVGTTVSGLAGATDLPAGNVDPFVSSSVAQYEKFLLIVKGPTKVLSGAAITAKDRLKATTNGLVITNPATNTAELSVGFGIAIEAATASALLKRALVDYQSY